MSIFQGTIKRTIAEKGFGFITADGTEQDLFFHISGLNDMEFEALEEGMRVRFKIGENDRGEHATDITVIESNGGPSDIIVLNDLRIRFNSSLIVPTTEFDIGTTTLPDGMVYSEGLYVNSNRISNLKRLALLEELIKDPNVKESDFQYFFEENTDLLLSKNYERLIPQATIVANDNQIWKADFVLVPHDQLQFAKIVELKRPQTKISLKANSGHHNFGANFKKAIDQGRHYAEAFDSDKTRLLFKEKYGTDIIKPEVQLLVGRRNSIMDREAFLKYQKSQKVTVTDWDTFYDQLKRTFK